MSTFTDRVIRAVRLDRHLYEEVEQDRTATGQAMGVVVLASAAGGLAGGAQSGTATGLIAGALGALLGWYVWAFVIYVVGTKILPAPSTQADMGQLLRTLGFSAAPGMIRVLGIVPALAGLTLVIAQLWSLVAMVVAVRQALDYESTGRAVAVCVVGWLVQILVLVIIAVLFVGAGGSLIPAGSTRSA